MNYPVPRIVPALIPESLEGLGDELLRLEDVSQAFQIDIVDGSFVPYSSWPYTTDADPKDLNACIAEFEIELDLMIEDPEHTLATWLETTAARFVIHVESTDEVVTCIEMVRDRDRKIGLALNNDTPLGAIEDYIPRIDFVQCMGIAEIGKQGNAFDERVLQRVRDLKAAYPGLEIAVDGSINADTIERVYEAGATRLISGSAIIRAESPIGAYNDLLRLVS